MLSTARHMDSSEDSQRQELQMVCWSFAVHALDLRPVLLELLTLCKDSCCLSYGGGSALRVGLVRWLRETRHHGPLSSSSPCWPGDQMLRQF